MNKTNNFKKSKLYNKLFNNRFIFLSMIGSVLLSVLIAYCYDMIPFGDTTILRMDLYHQYGPLFAELFERIKDGGSFLYSWNSGGGSSFLGNFYNYLASPLTFLILFFKHKSIPILIGVLIFIKATLSSATFTLYLKKSLGKHSYITAGFGVLYAFSGFFIAYYWNLMWLDAMVMLPILLLGIERIINKGKPLTFIVALSLTMFSNYYMSYMACLFSVICFLFYYFANYSYNAKLADYRNPLDRFKSYNQKGVYNFRSSRFINSGLTFAFGAILSALIVAFALIPTFYILKACSATSGTFPEGFSLYNDIFDFIANHLASVEPTIRSSGDDVLPNVYCGIITVMLLPMFYFTKSIKLREKISTTALLAVLFFSFNTNYLNYIWHGFHFPNDLPYRFSFMYSFILLVIAFKTLTRIKEFKPKEILGVGIATVLFIVFVEKIGSKNVTTNTVLISLAFAVIYTVGFYILSNKKYNRQAVALFMFCCVVSEYAVANTDNYVMNQDLTSYSSDLADFNDAKEIVDKDHGNSNIYRMELSELRTRMDPCWYNYNGVSTFSSMAYENLSNLQQYLGLYGNFINSYTYYMQTPIYNSMFSLDYILNNNSNIDMNSDLFSMLGGNDTFTAYKNNYSLPIAYMTKSNIKKWDYDNYNPFEVQSDFFERATGIKNVFSHVNVYDVSGNAVSDISGLDEDETYLYFTPDSTDGDGEVTILVQPEKSQNLYLYVNSSDLASLTVNNCGKELNQDLDDEKYILDLGMCVKDEIITITLKMKEGVDEEGYADFYLNALNLNKFTEGYNILKDQSLNAETFEDTKIEGKITAKENGILYTSIPYDDGWKVTIDGKEVDSAETVSIGNALLGVYVSKGTHNVSFNYTPKGLKIGICASVFGLIILLAYLFILRKIKIVRKYTMLFDESQEHALSEEYKAEIDRQNEFIRLQELEKQQREAAELSDTNDIIASDDNENTEES